MDKICKKCQVIKNLCDFNKSHAICKVCYNAKRKVINNKVTILTDKQKYSKEYYEKNKLKIKNYVNNYRKDYVRKNKIRIKYKMSGYIYIICNPAWKDYIKLGRTKNINYRLSQYQIGSPFKDYEIYFSCYTTDLAAIEYYFSNNIEGNYEWFKIDKDKAVDIINNIISTY